MKIGSKLIILFRLSGAKTKKLHSEKEQKQFTTQSFDDFTTELTSFGDIDSDIS